MEENQLIQPNNQIIACDFVEYINQHFSHNKEKIDYIIRFNSISDREDFISSHAVILEEIPNDKVSENLADEEKSKEQFVQFLEIDKEIYEIYLRFNYIPALLIGSKISALNILFNEKKIQRIDANYRMYISMDKINRKLNLTEIKNSLYNPTGESIKIMLIDTGIDKNHPALVNTTIIKQYNLTNSDKFDSIGHGTIQTMIIGGVLEGQDYNHRGIAPDVEFIDIKVVDDNGIVHISDVLMSIDLCREEIYDLILFGINCPIASDGHDILSLVCNKLTDEESKIIIAPCGNFGPDPMTIGTPACAKNVISVGTIDNMENMAFFSSRGATYDGRIKPDCVFPGVKVTIPMVNGILGKKSKFYKNSIEISGTSISASIAAGVISLIKSVKLDLTQKEALKLIKKCSNNVFYSKKSQGNGLPNITNIFKEINMFIPRPMKFQKLMKISGILSTITASLLIGITVLVNFLL